MSLQSARSNRRRADGRFLARKPSVGSPTILVAIVPSVGSGCIAVTSRQQ
jgi:hypothetical protein